jgi:hypothetical protein
MSAYLEQTWFWKCLPSHQRISLPCQRKFRTVETVIRDWNPCMITKVGVTPWPGSRRPRVFGVRGHWIAISIQEGNLESCELRQFPRNQTMFTYAKSATEIKNRIIHFRLPFSQLLQMGNVSSPIHTISICLARVSPHIHLTCRALQVKLLTEHYQSCHISWFTKRVHIPSYLISIPLLSGRLPLTLLLRGISPDLSTRRGEMWRRRRKGMGRRASFLGFIYGLGDYPRTYHVIWGGVPKVGEGESGWYPLHLKGGSDSEWGREGDKHVQNLPPNRGHNPGLSSPQKYNFKCARIWTIGKRTSVIGFYLFLWGSHSS